MSRVLIVEDEEHLAAGLKLNLEEEGFTAEVEEDGAAALQRLLGAGAGGFDVVLLDVMLPGLDGFEVVRRLRAARQFVPVMLLTARSDNDDVLRGFEAGADDYLPKPFDLSILLARLAGLLRRRRWLRGDAAAGQEELDEYRFAGVTVDFGNQLLRRGRSEQPLTVMEATLLRYLVGMLARLAGLLRRRRWLRGDAAAGQEELDEYRFAGVTVDFGNQLLRRGRSEQPLTVMEATLLRYLVSRAGETVSRKALLEEVWGVRHDTDTRTVDNFIARLRRYIEARPAHPRHLLTVRGVGYRFIDNPDESASRAPSD